MADLFSLFNKKPQNPYSSNSTALEILNGYTGVRPKKASSPVETEKPPTNYVYEQGGMLVYHNKAQVRPYPASDLQFKQSLCERNSKPQSKEIEKGSESDIRAFYRLRSLESIPSFATEYVLEVPNDSVTLRFESKFESGNLEKAVKLSDYDYLLFLKNDTNTSNHNHWFYFSVHNPRKTSVEFKITNMLKADTLFDCGMKIAVWSSKRNQESGLEWHRDGTNISYTENTRSGQFLGSRSYYTLSFRYDFKFAGDTVYFAYSVPYTYSHLKSFLEEVRNNHSKIARVNPLCESLGGNVCDLVTITSNIHTYTTFEEEAHEWNISANGRKLLRMRKKRSQDRKKKDSEHTSKKGIVISARVHSGETVSSHMMQGVMDFLLGDSREAKLLRKRYIFRVIPMLNPDGVRHGNYRCSLLGVDLNRRWDKPNKALHPTIYYSKKMMEVFAEKHEVLMYCDLHGHGRKQNIFMYGCAVRTDDVFEKRKNLLAKVIPVLLAHKNPMFCFKDCHFRMEKSKESTARIVVFREFGVAHSYTMEASFFGPKESSAFGNNYRGNMHMTEEHLQKMGEDLCRACLTFSNKRLYWKRIWFTNNYLRKLMEVKPPSFLNKKPQFQEELQEPQPQKETQEQTTPQVKQLPQTQEVFQNHPESLIEEEKTNEAIEETIEVLEKVEETEPLRLDEETWNNVEIVEYSEDEEGSGGSDSCPSEPESLGQPKKVVLEKIEVLEEKEVKSEQKHQRNPKTSRYMEGSPKTSRYSNKINFKEPAKKKSLSTKRTSKAKTNSYNEIEVSASQRASYKNTSFIYPGLSLANPSNQTPRDSKVSQSEIRPEVLEGKTEAPVSVPKISTNSKLDSKPEPKVELKPEPRTDLKLDLSSKLKKVDSVSAKKPLIKTDSKKSELKNPVMREEIYKYSYKKKSNFKFARASSLSNQKKRPKKNYPDGESSPKIFSMLNDPNRLGDITLPFNNSKQYAQCIANTTRFNIQKLIVTRHGNILLNS